LLSTCPCGAGSGSCQTHQRHQRRAARQADPSPRCKLVEVLDLSETITVALAEICGFAAELRAGQLVTIRTWLRAADNRMIRAERAIDY
jgi:hypothetical protein